MSSAERVPEQPTLAAVEMVQRPLTHDEAHRQWVADNPFHLRFTNGNFSEVSIDFTTPGFDPAALVPIREQEAEAA